MKSRHIKMKKTQTSKNTLTVEVPYFVEGREFFGEESNKIKIFFYYFIEKFHR